MYAIHLPRSSLFCAQAARRSGERGLISVACKGRSATNPAPASRRTCLHQWPPGWEGSAMPTARASCFQSVFSLICRQASSSFPGTPAGKQGRSESGRHSNALPARIQGHPRTVSSGRQPSRYAGQSPWQPRVLSFRPSPEKNRPGRPCGAWLPRKKTL